MWGVSVWGVCVRRVCWMYVPAKDIYQLKSKLLVFKEDIREIARDLRERERNCEGLSAALK